MLKKILLIVVPLIAFAAGAFGGLQLKAGKDPVQAELGNITAQAEHSTDEGHSASHGEDDGHSQKSAHAAGGSDSDHGGGHGDNKGHDEEPETFTFPSQFFVPLVRRGDPDALMIMTISLQTSLKDVEPLEKQEHRLRDLVLRQLLIVANTGGFDGNFTTEGRQRAVRKAVLEAVQHEFGDTITEVLIGDMIRQAS